MSGKEVKGKSREGTLGDNVSDLEMKNEHGGKEIFKFHNCRLEDVGGHLSGRNVTPECSPTSDPQ